METLKQLVERHGSEALDEIVHEAASRAASRANNDGPDAQLEFLEQAGFSEQEIRDHLAQEDAA